ncbi:DUF4360 domain-containing protein [Catenuloplanes japonicus]|uniref:DUF4360 domain-containing protein n=1 Tax=Catenuloplanes japonicus TaxID=33876 RepID=UPI00068F101B|nr:DUF4360 domain-containing protein [Catenuloplanes japonicus]
MLSNGAAASAVALLLLGGSAVDAPLERAAPKVSAAVASTGGSGCPGAVATVTATGADGFTLRFPGFTARAGGSAPLTERRRNCMVGVNIDRPAGWTFTLRKAEYRGNAQLAKGAVGTMQATYYFSASRSTARYTRTLKGPLRSAWQGGATDFKELGWAPCDSARTLNINTEVRVTPGPDRKQKSQMETGAGGKATATYHLSWKKC